MTVRTAWREVVALSLIWIGTLLTVFVGVPELIPDISIDTGGDVVDDNTPAALAALAQLHHFMVYAGLGMTLLTAGIILQGWEAGSMIWRGFQRR